ncbi:AraC family transcriptional regulator [Cupriavidus oxalaticus]|uniref:AraC family transcriptional regulator n=1 Tax=Cupriavidus oxalaticus TaxID=96344 RepID=UPI00317613AD
MLDGGLVFDHRHWVCGEAEFRWSAPRHLIVLTERGTTARTCVSSEGRVMHDGRDGPGTLSFVPAHAERSGHFRDADLVYTALWLDPALGLPGCDRLAQLPMRINDTADAVVQALLKSLSAEMAAGRVPEAVYLEHLVSLVSLRIAGAMPAAPVRRMPGVGKRLLARLTDYIDSRLDTPLSLSDLAGVAGMPVDTFARRFKAETGMAPYAYVISRRVRRAQCLLRGSPMPISAMALELGFSSQSHFTSTFQRLTGTTPRSYRTHMGQDSDISS